jgi:hypothetical protein
MIDVRLSISTIRAELTALEAALGVTDLPQTEAA